MSKLRLPRFAAADRVRALLLSAFAAAVALAAVPAVAGAATVDVRGGSVLTITGGDGEEDFLFTVGNAEPAGGFELNTYSTTTGFIELTAAAEDFGCALRPDGSATILCPAGVSRIAADLRAGDDEIDVLQLGEAKLNVPFSILGGAGEDWLGGSAGADAIDGGSGDDTLRGCDEVAGDAGDRLTAGDGDDELVGCDGNDVLNGGAGDDDFDFGGFSADVGAGGDTYIGGPGGADHFSYFARPENVRVSLDGVANDGAAGEGDDVGADIEEIGGSWGDDVIVGSGAGEYLWGDMGSDEVHGGGDDTVKGSEGVDEVDGGPGDDEVDGGCHADTIIGGSGVDTLISDGGCGTDESGSADRSPLDVLDAADGTPDELVFCQIDSVWDPAGDTARVDPSDPVTTSGPGRCRTVNVVRVPPADEGCVVPKLKKKSVRRAKGLLAKAGCAPGKVRRKRSKKVRKGLLISTRPGAGAERPAGAEVSLVVSKGK